MGAHAICDETKCKIPVYPKTETYSKTEVNKLISEVKSSIELANATFNTYCANQDLLHSQIDDRFTELSTRINSIEANLNGLITMLNVIETRLTVLETKVGG